MLSSFDISTNIWPVVVPVVTTLPSLLTLELNGNEVVDDVYVPALKGERNKLSPTA